MHGETIKTKNIELVRAKLYLRFCMYFYLYITCNKNIMSIRRKYFNVIYDFC
jgi:hypothetical protein